MKVVCIDDKPRNPEHYLFPQGFISKDEIYTVIGHLPEGDLMSEDCYIISEKPVIFKYDGQTGGWSMNRFVPLEYYKKEFANVNLETQTA